MDALLSVIDQFVNDTLDRIHWCGFSAGENF